MRVEVIADVKPLLSEGPVWNTDSEPIYFIDCLGRRIFRCTEQEAEFRVLTVPSVIGSMALRSDGGALWQLDVDLTVHHIDTGTICSNGPYWSPHGRTLYAADSFRGTIFAYDYNSETGHATNRRDFARPDASRGGAPAGATVDDEGFVWTCMVFDEPGLDRLFVTSMAEPPLPKHPGGGPLRGSLFVVDGLGVRGRPEPRFAG